MKHGTGSTTELTKNHQGQSTKMTCVRPNTYINKYPRFSIELPLIVSRSLLSLTNYILYAYTLAYLPLNPAYCLGVVRCGHAHRCTPCAAHTLSSACTLYFRTSCERTDQPDSLKYQWEATSRSCNKNVI